MAEEVKVSKVEKTKGKFVRYVKDVRNELKRVIWPTKSQLINNTITVLVMCIIVGILIWLLDLGFGALYNLIY
ncbi:preprotein translocase subunit SecE [Acetivibrio mesophilus]|uniref:Protein translocase subunit SecE n=1 Tax=Acetivibrio mesophilus TaxID=2487273 RepID=A0A4Q0I5B4_9FIRM|nr:preprotein translocase subunit SecE [Acetivibrio mesophilus]ODM27511.1 preprotein translocase subunit SecE [Clostridium sp. Bc-iso-3]RXE59471.1 preprotein translocase subunit SecE [Acetivibrio mesophilus]HHV30262.1 preprotein translocase subunit SecE [Clostridium sp.]